MAVVTDCFAPSITRAFARANMSISSRMGSLPAEIGYYISDFLSQRLRDEQKRSCCVDRSWGGDRPGDTLTM